MLMVWWGSMVGYGFFFSENLVGEFAESCPGDGDEECGGEAAGMQSGQVQLGPFVVAGSEAAHGGRFRGEIFRKKEAGGTDAGIAGSPGAKQR